MAYKRSTIYSKDEIQIAVTLHTWSDNNTERHSVHIKGVEIPIDIVQYSKIRRAFGIKDGWTPLENAHVIED